MSDAKIERLAGFLCGLVISWLLIHFMAAGLIAKILGVSVTVAYWSLVGVLLLWGMAMIVLIIRDDTNSQ